MLKQRQTSRDRDRDDDWSHNPDINSEDDPGEIVSRISFSFFFTEFYWVFRTVTPGLSWFYLVLPGFTVRLCFFFVKILLWCYPFFFNLLLRGVYLVLPGFAAKFLSRGSSFQVLPSFTGFRGVVPITVRLCFFLSRYCFGVNRFF